MLSTSYDIQNGNTTVIEMSANRLKITQRAVELVIKTILTKLYTKWRHKKKKVEDVMGRNTKTKSSWVGHVARQKNE